MKSSTIGAGFFQNIAGLLARIALLTCVCAGTRTLAAPRPSWAGLIPDSITPLYREDFDESFYWGSTNSQITLEGYIFNESWSGYALQRSGSSVAPFVVPGVDSTGYTNLNGFKGTIRFWFKPSWSSSTTNGTGPGSPATLLELAAIAKNQSANVWTLQVSADGTALSLISRGDSSPEILLQAAISWRANQSHMIVLNYSTNTTELFIDGQLTEKGAATVGIPTQISTLILGSSLSGNSVAGGDFDELSCFGPPSGSRFARSLSPMDIQFYYTALSGMAAMGPISQEEITAREQRRQELKAARLAELKSLGANDLMSDGGGMEAMAMRGSYGGFAGDCVTNVQVYLTNVWAGFETNNTLTVTFDVVGGTNGFIYDVFTSFDMTSQPWYWVTNTPTCSTVVLPNQPTTQSFYMIRDGGRDGDGDGILDYADAAPNDPTIGILSVFIDNPANGAVLQ